MERFAADGDSTLSYMVMMGIFVAVAAVAFSAAGLRGIQSLGLEVTVTVAFVVPCSFFAVDGNNFQIQSGKVGWDASFES